ncbi:hypothetical protein CQA01_08640 [Cyclobacterium qasimii]|uniref:Uncharacterized protein n=1 Tax=Cyclobacterium qasimii TaxID=1350429 RepID=A0A512C842_9BACT|nr:hypothetical protein CQA01_08640 [Cyclobacterium qasimii]
MFAIGISKIKEMIPTSARIAVDVNANNPIFPKILSGYKFPKNPIPSNIEHMAVAGDILPGLLFEKTSVTKILSIEMKDIPRYSPIVITPIKIKILANIL